MLTLRKEKKSMQKGGINKMVLFLIALALCFSVVIFFIYSPRNARVTYGVTFSKDFSQYLGLDWRENYIALLDDLKVRRLRLPVYWTEIEATQGEYDFSNIDWQISQARLRGAQIVIVVGQKQPRWPECHIPGWVGRLTDAERKVALETTITTVINRYMDNDSITAWQVENEPFLPYGECPAFDKNLLDDEIAIVRKLDPTRPVIITDSGELSTWYSAASRADVLGTTLYRIVWNENLGYVHYPISSLFYRMKAALIMYFTDVQKIIIMELQGEPWGPSTILDTPLDEQYRSMNPQQFRKNIEFVKNVEFSEAYLWGGEWWYWLKVKKGDDSMWEAARGIF